MYKKEFAFFLIQLLFISYSAIGQKNYRNVSKCKNVAAVEKHIVLYKMVKKTHNSISSYSFDSIFVSSLNNDSLMIKRLAPIVMNYDLKVLMHDSVAYEERNIKGNKVSEGFKAFIQKNRRFAYPKDHKLYNDEAMQVVVSGEMGTKSETCLFNKTFVLH